MASIHPIKMLYIWPYFMFFSFPLLYSSIVIGLVPQDFLPRALRHGVKWPKRPRLIPQLLSIVLMLATVQFNTTVHPFTLADNRHYMFYVFRLLLRNRLIRYAVVPVYYYCAWATIAAFGGMNQCAVTSACATPDSTRVQDDLHDRSARLVEPKPSGGMRISFFLMWSLATSLSLITAPLVEPRYFIVPWLFWRLHVYSPLTKSSVSEAKNGNDAIPIMSDRAIRSFIYPNYEFRLGLETAWFLFINWATAYVFLYWGFEWPQEPGKVQRFMW